MGKSQDPENHTLSGFSLSSGNQLKTGYFKVTELSTFGGKGEVREWKPQIVYSTYRNYLASNFWIPGFKPFTIP